MAAMERRIDLSRGRKREMACCLGFGQFKFGASSLIFTVFFIFLLLFFDQPVLASPSFFILEPEKELDYSQIITAYEKFVREQMTRDRVPGLSVAFRHKDFFWAQGFGYADLENDVPARPESSYRLASITKTITAVAILLLYEEGRIDLDAEVQKYVPSFPRKPWPITIRQLLGHLGGIPHYRNYDQETHIREPKNTQEALAIFQHFNLVAEPGTRYNYSTYGYNLLGAVIEGVANIPYGEFIRQRIFEPLGMADSRLDDPATLIPHRVRGYRLIQGNLQPSEFVDVSSRFAGGGTRSTVLDLVRYGYGLIIEGKLLKPETRKMMLASMTLRNGFFTNYGMGWVVEPWHGHFYVNHTGSQPETRTHLAIFPEDKLVIAVACNLEGTNLLPYIRKLAELIFDEEMDLTYYTTSVENGILWKACEQVFNYGISHYSWHRSSLSSSFSELKAGFETFNRLLQPKRLLQNREEARKLAQAGVHPAGRQVLTKIGSFMASVLNKNSYDALNYYRQKGPLAFFLDYIKMSESAGKSLPRFSPEIKTCLQEWNRDGVIALAPEIREPHLAETIGWSEYTRRLKLAFANKKIYPDLSAVYLIAAQDALNKQQNNEAMEIIRLGLEVYPLSPSLQAALGVASLWAGDVDRSRRAFTQAFSSDPYHPSLSSDRFINWAGQLVRVKKTGEAIELLEIALNFYPRQARLYYEYGRLNLLVNNKEKAIQALERALLLDPNLEEAKLQLEELKKGN